MGGAAVRGRGVVLEGETEVRVLRPGDYLLIPAHCRHRVEWTDPEQKTVWLALHFRVGASRAPMMARRARLTNHSVAQASSLCFFPLSPEGGEGRGEGACACVS